MELEEFITQNLNEVSTVTGIPFELMDELHIDKKMEIITLGDYIENIDTIQKIVNDDLVYSAADDIAIFLGIDKEKLNSLPFDTLSQVCGMFEMENSITSDDVLKDRLLKLMEGNNNTRSESQ